MSLRKNGEFGFEKTLCENCLNAVPNASGTRGCNWSISFKPVEGWNAKPTLIKEGGYSCSGSNRMRLIKSFHVIDCPEFKEG